MSVLADVLFALLDAGENLLKESLVLWLLTTVFQSQHHVREPGGAGQATASADAGKRTVG